jgi:tRNA synthetases class I (E and Q), anti-codon binding domain
VRLRSAYFVTCREVVKDASGSLIELHCTYDPATRGGESPDGRRPKATLHWIAANHAVPAEVRLYDYLFGRPDPGGDGRDLFEDLNPASETVLTGCCVEPSLAAVPSARLCSSSGWDTSRRTRIRRRTTWSLTGRSRSRTRGPRCRHGIVEVRGGGAKLFEAFGPPVASGQTVRHLTLDQGIKGSNPSSPASLGPGLTRHLAPELGLLPKHSASRDTGRIYLTAAP